MTGVARELGVSPESLRGWYEQAKADRGEGHPGELSTEVREKLNRLRKLAAEQAETIEVLRKAAVFFAKEKQSMNRVYAFMEAEKTTHDVTFLCRLLKVARSPFYAWLAAAKAWAAHKAADEALAHEITVPHVASQGTYGVPLVHAELRRLGRV